MIEPQSLKASLPTVSNFGALKCYMHGQFENPSSSISWQPSILTRNNEEQFLKQPYGITLI